jgi:hypothetical protein
MKDYKVGDIFGYRVRLMESPFNPDFPGRAPRPHFPFEPHTIMKGKQTFYGVAIVPVRVEGLLTTKEKTNFPMQLGWDGWEELDETDVDMISYEQAVEEGLKELRMTFEKNEKIASIPKNYNFPF